MKRKLLWSVVTIAALTFVSYLALKSDVSKVSAVSQSSNFKRFQQLNREAFEKNKILRAELRNHPPDPSVTDDVALGLVLRFISGNRNEQEKNQVRQYLSDVLGVSDRADQDKLLAVSETYKLRSNEIQMQSEGVTRKYHPSHSFINNADKQALHRLALSKTKLIKDSEKSLRTGLSDTAWMSIETALETQVKPRAKVSYHERKGDK